MKIRRLLLIATGLIIALIICWKYFFMNSKIIVYRFTSQTNSHCFIIYNDESGQKMKEISNMYYYNVSSDSKLNIFKTSSDVSENSIPFAFRNVSTEKTIVGFDEFSENGIFLQQDTLLTIDDKKSIGIFSFYLGNDLSNEVRQKHFDIRDSLLTNLSTAL